MKKIIFFIYLSVMVPNPAYCMHTKTLFTEVNKLSQLLMTTYKNYQNNNIVKTCERELKNIDPRIKNYLLKTMVFTEYYQYRFTITQLVQSDADPNIPNSNQIPLIIALDNNDIDFLKFLLEHYADPNLSIHPNPIDISMHQETGSNAQINHFSHKPAFYFAKNSEAAQLCLAYGADATLKYWTDPHHHDCTQSYNQDYGNVLTHIIDNKNYPTQLIALYLKHNAGPFSSSYASDEGSVLHHIIHSLNICSREEDSQRLLLCAKHLLNAAPTLLESKDYTNKTPFDCLNLNIWSKNNEHVRKQFVDLFDTYKYKSRE